MYVKCFALKYRYTFAFVFVKRISNLQLWYYVSVAVYTTISRAPGLQTCTRWNL